MLTWNFNVFGNGSKILVDGSVQCPVHHQHQHGVSLEQRHTFKHQSEVKFKSGAMQNRILKLALLRTFSEEIQHSYLMTSYQDSRYVAR